MPLLRPLQRSLLACIAAITSALTLTATAPAQPLTHEQLVPSQLRLDGNLSEWLDLAPAADDPAGDASGAFDLTRVWAANHGAMLYLCIEITEELNLQSGPEGDGTLVLTLNTPDGSRIDFDFRARKGLHSPPQGLPKAITWLEIGMRQSPTYASKTYELQLDLEPFGVEVGKQVSIQFSGSDSLDEPILFNLTPGHVNIAKRPIGPASLARAEGTQFRIASYNTEHNGLRDEAKPDRRDAIHRVVAAAAADIYCFQEEWTASADSIRRVMESIDPHHDTKPWSVVFDNGAAVASRYPIIAMPDIPNQRAAGAIVKITESPADAVLVYSVHLKCCGHINSKEDNQRIAEANAIADQVEQLRRGQLGPAFADYADVPVVICGDYNLVGSRTPLTILETRLGMAAQDLPHMLSDKTYTWYEEDSPFSPGRLDYITASPNARQLNGFIVNPRHFGRVLSRQMGMRQSDVAATDHLLMITDMYIRR